MASTRIKHHLLNWTGKLTRLACASVLLALGAASVLVAGANREPAQGKSELSDTVRLRLEVTGGETSTPIDSASIYVRYVVKHRMGKDESVEMNLKTNHEGTVIVTDVPRGEVTVQVIA